MRINCSVIIFLILTGFSFSFVQGQDNGLKLIISTYEGNLSQVDSLLKEGADVNSMTIEGYTAIMYAAESGNIPIAKLLIDSGVNVNYNPFLKTSALHAAIKNNHIEMCELLIRNGAKIKCYDSNFASPLFYAAAYGYDTLCDLLIYYGASDFKYNYYRTSSLMVSSYYGHIEIVDLLLHYGAIIDLIDAEQRTALFYAVDNNQPEIVELLLNKGANISDTTREGVSPLILAAYQGNYEIVEIFLRKCNDFNINSDLFEQKVLKEADKNTALSYATYNKNKNVQKLLKRYGATYKNKLFISDFTLFLDNYFSKNDYMFGGGIGLNEAKSNSMLNFGFNSRLMKKSVLIEQEDNLFYQFREQRYIFYSSFEKHLDFINTNELETGFIVGIKGLFTFGKYRGTKIDVKNEFLLAPEIGYFYRKGSFTYKILYEYLDFGIYQFSPHRINLSIVANIRLHKLNYKKINIAWL